MKYILATAVAGALAITGCTRAPEAKILPPGVHIAPTPTPAPTKAKTLKETLLSTAGKTMIQSKKGRQWMMEVLKVVWSEEAQKAHVKNVDWTLTDKKNRKVLRVQAPAATYTPENNRIEFEGRVVASRYFNKDKITVNHLVWEGKRSEFVGTQGVRWEKEGVVVTGNRMNAPDSLAHIHVEGDVHATGLIEELSMP